LKIRKNIRKLLQEPEKMQDVSVWATEACLNA
jgi:hypothetical protein